MVQNLRGNRAGAMEIFSNAGQDQSEKVKEDARPYIEGRVPSKWLSLGLLRCASADSVTQLLHRITISSIINQYHERSFCDFQKGFGGRDSRGSLMMSAERKAQNGKHSSEPD